MDLFTVLETFQAVGFRTSPLLPIASHKLERMLWGVGFPYKYEQTSRKEAWIPAWCQFLLVLGVKREKETEREGGRKWSVPLTPYFPLEGFPA